MIRHYYPSRQFIFFAVELMQHFNNGLGDQIIIQMSFADAAVQIPLDFTLYFYIGNQIFFEFRPPLFQHVLRQRIRQTKGQKLKTLSAVKMRQIPATIPTFWSFSHTVKASATPTDFQSNRPRGRRRSEIAREGAGVPMANPSRFRQCRSWRRCSARLRCRQRLRRV